MSQRPLHTNDALSFLKWLRPEGPWVVTSISPDKRGIHTKTFDASTVDDLMAWLKQHNGVDNCYVMVNPARRHLDKKASKEDVEALAFLHVDCDPPKGADLQSSRAEILTRLTSFKPAPHAIIDSGGGYQAFWRLDAPVFVGGVVAMAEEMEAYNQQLELVLKGDHCFNIDRIMRIPGTWNMPDEKKRKAGRVEAVAAIVGELSPASLPLDQFTPAPRSSPTPPPGLSAQRVVIGGNLAPVLIDDLPEAVPQRIKMLIVQGSDPDEPTKYASRSEVSWAVTCGLVRAGCDDNTVASILLDRDYAASAHCLDQRRPMEYVARQIQRAKEVVGCALRLTDFYAYMPMHSYIFIPGRELWPSSSVNSRLGPVPVSGGTDGKPEKIAASRWLDQHRPVEQMTWAPGQPELIEDRLISDGGWISRPGCHVFNNYRPPSLPHGDAASAQPWIKLLRKIYPDAAEHIIDWLAQRVQRPHEKINHALVLGGSQGIGKDTILEPVKAAIGPWNFAEVSPSVVLGRFNSYVKSVILRVSEARDLGDVDRFSFYDHMKTYTAAPPDVLRIDEKHLREYYSFNVCGVIITSNHKGDGIFLPEDDRRHYVAWSDCNREDFEEGYWREIWNWYANGGLGHVAALLSERDISHFDAKAPPPKTAAFWDIVASNTAPESSELTDALEKLRWPKTVTISEVVKASNESFGAWITDRRNSRKIPHKFEECGYRPVRNPDAQSGRWKVDGAGVVIYARRELSLRDAIQAVADAQESRRSPY